LSSMQELRDKIVSWLASAGFIVAPMQGPLPQNAEWGLGVSTPPPLQVKLRLIGLKHGIVIAGIGVNFSDIHREKLKELEDAERVSFMAELTRRLLLLCPYCRLAVQGGMLTPELIIAEIVYYAETLAKQRLLDDLARLVNIFLLVNTELMHRFPEPVLEAAKHGEPSGTSFM